MLLNRMREDVHDFYLKLRMLDRLLETEEFERAYESAVDFRMLKSGIEELDVDLIKFFILLNRDPGELSVRELRRAARHFNVAFWSRLTKLELIDEVDRARLNCRTREVDRQIDLLSNPGGHKTPDADRGNPLAGCCVISRRIGLYSMSATAARVASRLRRESISSRNDVGEHGDAGSNWTPGAEDTRDVTNGPPIALES